LISSFTDFPFVVIGYNCIRTFSSDWADFASFIASTFAKVDCLEVVKLGFIKVRDVPEKADVFETKVVPFVGVRVVRHFVFMHILSLAPDSSDASKFTTVALLRSAASVSELSWNPTTINNDSSSFN
jgi:hypothetical protein